jgi:hypothetical protein
MSVAGGQQRVREAVAQHVTPSTPATAFVDVVNGRHAATDPRALLDKRRLVWHKDYGWTYDVWVDRPEDYALSGAHGRWACRLLEG